MPELLLLFKSEWCMQPAAPFREKYSDRDACSSTLLPTTSAYLPAADAGFVSIGQQWPSMVPCFFPLRFPMGTAGPQGSSVTLIHGWLLKKD